LEEGLLFWLDANDYTLLFAKADLHTKAKAIFSTYMSDTAKYKVNISDAQVNEIKKIVESPLSEVEIDGTLFVIAQEEVLKFLQLDVWERYVEWSKAAGKIGRKGLERTSTSAELLDESRLGDREKMREAVIELLAIPDEVENFKVIAKQLDCEEAIEFYLEIKAFQQLFAAQDFKDSCKRLWSRFLDDKADRMVNLPSAVHKKLKEEIITKDCADTDIKTFDRANREILHLITDNVYPAWLKKFKAEAAAEASAKEAKKAAAGAAPKSGGCCTIS